MSQNLQTPNHKNSSVCNQYSQSKQENYNNSQNKLSGSQQKQQTANTSAGANQLTSSINNVNRTSIAKNLFSNSSDQPNFKSPAPPGQREDPIKIVLPEFKPKNECNVIKIIQKEWEREVERLNIKKYGKRPINSNESKLNSDHLLTCASTV